MPDVPTSVLLGFLALCWLVVLVPMVARSREPVPETDDDARGFRVLRRSRRARGDRMAEGGSVHDHDDLDDDLDGRFADDGADDARSTDGLADAGLVDDIVETQADWEPTRSRAGSELDDEMHDEHDQFGSDERADDRGRYRSVERPLRAPRGAGEVRAHRPGRGGFDPEHAAETAAYRYRRRRTVTLVLLVLAVASGVIGQLLDPRGWIGTAVFGATVVAYLAYLSRQTRIEREIRERRMARLRRAHEIHPPVRRSGPVSPYGGAAEFEQDLEQDETAVTARVPAAARRPGVVVDLDDDDPAFDDLEYYEPVVYRRAAGQ